MLALLVRGDSSFYTFVDDKSPINRLLVLSAIGDGTTGDNYVRFNNSVSAFNLDIEFVRYTKPAKTALISNEGAKLDKLLERTRKHKDVSNLVVLVVENENLIINGNQTSILSRFSKLISDKPGAKIIFSADQYCWPDATLAEQYPVIDSSIQEGRRYLNSRAFIGFASSINDLLEYMHTVASDKKSESDPGQEFNFQEQVSSLYINETLRNNLSIILDHKSELFESLDAQKANSEDDLELVFEPDQPDVVEAKNLHYNSRPVVIHAGGSAKVSVIWVAEPTALVAIQKKNNSTGSGSD